MNSEWKTKKLGGLVRFSSGGTPNKNIASYWDGNIPWVSAKTMKTEAIETSDLFITEDGLNHGSKLAPIGSLLLLVRGSGLFNGIPICYVRKPVAYNQDVKCIESISEIENKFIFYWLIAHSDYLKKKLETTSIGAGKFDTKFLSDLDVTFPEKKTRGYIISIADAISGKIELNNRINKILDEQIRTLCNAWLNDFVPFGGICPDDWELTPLSSIARFVSGYSYKSNELQESSVAMATIKNFDRHGGFKLDGYKEIIPSNKLKPEHHVAMFDTLVAHTDLTQNAEVIGNAEPVLSFSGYNDIIFSMDVVKVLPNNHEVSKFLIAAILQTQQFKSHCLGYVNGTTVLHLSKKALPEYSLMLPKDFSVLKPLDEAVSSMYQQMALNIDENVQLAKLRDSLLPRLMSGELDVSEVDI